MIARRGCIWLCLVVLFSGAPVWGQGGTTAPAPPVAPAEPLDPLGRDTPRGTVVGFMTAARDGKTDVAPLYLNSNLKGPAAEQLANQLYVVLNGRLPVRMNTLSDRPEGSLANPLTPNQNVVGTIPTSGGQLDIVVERVRPRNAPPVWVFARTTLESIPDVYSEVDLLSLDRYLPRFLRHRIAGVRLFEWLALAILIPLLYRLLGALDWVIRPVLVWWQRRIARSADNVSGDIPGAVRLLLLALAIRAFVPSVDLPLVERQFWAMTTGLLAIAGTVGLLLLLVDYGERYLLQYVRSGNLAESRALLRLLRRVAELLVIAAGGVAMLHYFGVNPTAALAGLGIGGIAVALAAQKTLENVIGGFSIVFDKAVRVGDVLKLGDMSGTVDRIGLRSTRIRTLDRTIVSVPNGQIATASIETLSQRDKFWFHHVVGLRYQTTAAQMRTVIAGMRQTLGDQPGVDLESVRARFVRLGPSSLDIEVFAYIFAADWVSFLAVQQDLLLRIMEIVEQAGTEIAFPSQTVHLADARMPSLASAHVVSATTVRHIDAREDMEAGAV